MLTLFPSTCQVFIWEEFPGLGFWWSCFDRRIHTSLWFSAHLPALGKVIGSSWGLLRVCLSVMMGALQSFGWQATLALALPLALMSWVHSFLALLEMLCGTVRQNRPIGVNLGGWSAECAELCTWMPAGTGQSLQDCGEGAGGLWGRRPRWERGTVQRRRTVGEEFPRRLWAMVSEPCLAESVILHFRQMLNCLSYREIILYK